MKAKNLAERWDWGAFGAGCFCWSVVAAVCIADLVFHVIPYPGNVLVYVGVGGLICLGLVFFLTVLPSPKIEQ